MVDEWGGSRWWEAKTSGGRQNKWGRVVRGEDEQGKVLRGR